MMMGMGHYHHIGIGDLFDKRVVFEYKTSFIPRRCYNTGRRVWGVAVRGRSTWSGPGEPVVEERWYHRHEAVIIMIKGTK